MARRGALSAALVCMCIAASITHIQAADECQLAPPPCGDEQTCHDPNHVAPNDFVCACKHDASRNVTGRGIVNVAACLRPEFSLPTSSPALVVIAAVVITAAYVRYKKGRKVRLNARAKYGAPSTAVSAASTQGDFANAALPHPEDELAPRGEDAAEAGS